MALEDVMRTPEVEDAFPWLGIWDDFFFEDKSMKLDFRRVFVGGRYDCYLPLSLS